MTSSTQSPNNTKISTFNAVFDKNYQSLRRELTAENAMLVMIVSAYVAYLNEAQQNPIADLVGNLMTAKDDAKALPHQLAAKELTDQSLLTPNVKIEQILRQFYDSQDLDVVIASLIKLLSDTAHPWQCIQADFSQLQQQFLTAQAYAQQITPLLYQKLHALSIKNQWGDPLAISLLLKGIIGETHGLTLYDGASGVANSGFSLAPGKLILREIHMMPALLSRLLLTMVESDAELKILDSLTAKEESHQADIGICLPSFGNEIQPFALTEVNYLQPLNVFHTIPSSASESLWVQLYLYHLNDKGRAYLILPIGWLFKGGYDLAVREALVHQNLIESVTLLPLGILQYSQANVCLVVLNTAKTTDAFWLMTAENMLLNGKYGGEVAEQSMEKIIDFIKNPTENNAAVKVTQAQIAQYKYDLNPKRYFKDPLEIATLELTTELTALADYKRQYDLAKVQLDKLLSSIAKQS